MNRITIAFARWRAIRAHRRLMAKWSRGEELTAAEFERLRELFEAARMTPRSRRGN